MLNTKFSGIIDMIGTGRFTSNWFVRRSFIKIGDNRLRNVMASDELDDFLEGGLENEEAVNLSVGWLMFYRWLLVVNHSGETERQSLFFFIPGIITHIFVTGLAGIIGGAIVYEVVSSTLGILLGIGIVAYGLVTSILNFKAWLAPDF
ncbi:MAG: hypothetical protein KAS98_02135 [Deltaproteobacteria bacterium]|nr:hypothetical protein [Deltaproteobacteria bacterium]